MKRRHSSIRIIFGVTAFTFCALSALGQTTNKRSKDETGIRQNVKYLLDGWNTKNGVLFAKAFAVDADYVVINGMQIKGRQQIADGHQQIFDTIYKESTLSLTVKQVRFLRSDVAVVHVAGTNTFKQASETKVLNAIITLVMTKDKGEWTIAAFQNTQVLGQ
jgi:uncharacterized protein (TIGR02246 family)